MKTKEPDENLRSRSDSILENSPVGIIQMTLDGRWLSVNPRLAEILGLDSSDVIHTSFRDFLSGDQFNEIEMMLEEIINGSRQIFVCEPLINRADGVEIWIRLSVSLVRSKRGRPLFFVAMLDNIQERKEAEESLQFALEASQMGEWDYDALINKTRRSRKFNSIFGYEEALEHWGFEQFESHIHPDDRAHFSTTFGQALFKGEFFNLEPRIVTRDGQVRWVSIKGRVYQNQLKQTVRMAGLIKDITDEKYSAQEIQNARLAAEDANREKSYFLANMSHEIRTPLGAILGFTEALRDPELNSRERERFLQILSRNGHALAALIGDILDLSKVEAGFLEIETSRVVVMDLVDEIVNLLRINAEAKNLKLNVETCGEIPDAIRADPIRLRQILLNIVGNAIKFTTKGSVTIRIETLSPDANPPRGLAFIVTDTGAGIAKQTVSRLFNPFTQADSSTTRNFGGTGLGLALSRRLARAMGGDLHLAKTEVDQGSTFVITIPAEESTHDQDFPAPDVVGGRDVTDLGCLNGLKVLVAEDSPDNQELIKRMLDARGAKTDLADDGAIAVEKALREGAYDLILMDMQMPRLDGYSATRELRQAGFRRPIVALTANAMRSDREKCLAAGCSEYLSKPIDSHRLYQTIVNAIQSLTH